MIVCKRPFLPENGNFLREIDHFYQEIAVSPKNFKRYIIFEKRIESRKMFFQKN